MNIRLHGSELTLHLPLNFSTLDVFTAKEMIKTTHQMGRVKRIWYLSPMRAAKVQASLRIRADSPEPPLLAHISSESRGTFRQKARSLAPLNGWHAQLKFVMTECSKTQIRLTRPKWTRQPVNENKCKETFGHNTLEEVLFYCFLRYRSLLYSKEDSSDR